VYENILVDVPVWEWLFVGDAVKVKRNREMEPVGVCVEGENETDGDGVDVWVLVCEKVWLMAMIRVPETVIMGVFDVNVGVFDLEEPLNVNVGVAVDDDVRVR
jgi:hypothetical protein